MNRLVQIETARLLARHALKGLTDKAGEPLFDHVCRVAQAQNTYEATITGYLHDLVEDTDTTLGEIDTIFGGDVAGNVDALSRRPGEAYRDYVVRLRQSGRQNAVAVKLADLADHLDPVRVHHIPESLQNRYRRAQAFLTGQLSEGEYLDR